ncbi:TPA: hypothetical protein DEB04_00565 [Candidatus Giovannonibacteria bacterium]|nr:hypothetical protein [Candidatus Giovannonibacteria bacterium]
MKILIVEDEPVHLAVMKSKLESEGYEVDAALDGEEGWRKLKTAPPDLVLLDVILPKLDGFQFLERAQKEKISVPIIIVSNSGQPVEIDKALKLGAKDCLVKAEFSPAEVLEKVQKVLGEKVVPKVKTSSQSPSNSEIYVGSRNHLLMVEDDKFLRDLIVQKLIREGFKMKEAVDGEEGLKMVREERPDLILLDLILPGLDGFEVLKRLKADAASKDIPVIVLSNLGQKEDMDRAMAAGAEAFMVKAHFTPGEIVAKIKATLKKKYF